MKQTFITADRLWNGIDNYSQIRPIIRVRGKFIDLLETNVGSTFDMDGEHLHFSGCTILPGLIDTHVHLVMSALDTNEAIITQVSQENDEQLLARIQANAESALRVGLTTVRDCGGKKDLVQQIRDRVQRGQLAGPEILSCGMPITTRRGHCHWLGSGADSYAEVEQAAQHLLDANADFLKVMATGGNMTASSDPMRPQYDGRTLARITEMARQQNKHAAAHVLSRSALPSVIAARYRTIEHCDWRVEEFRYAFDADLARQMIDQNQFVGLTMSGLARRSFLPQVRDLAIGPVQRLDARFACERQMIEFGVRYTIHSDAGVRFTPIDQFVLALRAAELELRLSPVVILRAVTSTAAEALELHDRGILQAGKRADLIVVPGDPLQDLQALERTCAVMKAGKWFRNHSHKDPSF